MQSGGTEIVKARGFKQKVGSCQNWKEEITCERVNSICLRKPSSNEKHCKTEQKVLTKLQNCEQIKTLIRKKELHACDFSSIAIPRKLSFILMYSKHKLNATKNPR